MNYQEQENEIVLFVKNNFNKYNDNVKIEHFINEFLDFDSYTYDNSLWFQFDDYTYEDLTNNSKLETSNLKIYIVTRNDIEKNLHERTRSYANSFYNMFAENGCNLGGIVDMGIINEVYFYDAIEADKSKKLVEINMTLLKEKTDYIIKE
jgi:hypothetical protein